jgi:hypothetical protein
VRIEGRLAMILAFALSLVALVVLGLVVRSAS